MTAEKRIYGLKAGRNYLVAEANSLRAMRGTVWIFIGISTLIEYAARLEKGGSLGNKKKKGLPALPDAMQEYASFIRRRFPARYKHFKYAEAPQPSDLPEQMYYVMRCGLVHAFSLKPAPRERANGARDRSIVINSRIDAKQHGMKHLDKFSKVPEIPDAAYFVDEDLLDDLLKAIDKLFNDRTKSVKKNISQVLRDQPFVRSH